MDAIIILDEESVIPAADQPMVRSILLHRADLAGEKISQRIFGGSWRGRREAEVAPILEVAEDHIVVEGDLEPIIQGVFSLGRSDHVTSRIKIGSSDRARKALSKREIP